MKPSIAGAVAVAAAQIALLVYMAGEREWIYRTGQPVVLRTAPIDPNDPMRGQYVLLDYDLNVVPRRLCSDTVAKWFDEPGIVYRRMRDRIVYARLKVAADNLAELVELTDVRPTDGTYLRGRTKWLDQNSIHVRYGIEAFFMQQGKARQLEDQMRNDRRGVLLNVEAAVSGSGTAVLRDYGWEPLGITFAFERVENTETTQPNAPRRRLRAMNVDIKNHSDKPVAIVDRPMAGSFRLVPNERVQTGKYEWADVGKPIPAARPEDVKVLQPGEFRSTRLDLESPRWFVRAGPDAEPQSMNEMTQAWDASFRIEYVPPRPEEIPSLPSADLIFPRTLRSRAFTPAGNID